MRILRVKESRPSFWPRRVSRVIATAAAVCGCRLDRLNATWVGLGAGSVGFGVDLVQRNDPRWTVSYFVSTLVFYYAGNGTLLRSRFSPWLIARYGEEPAFRIYQTILALMFIHQGLGIGTMTALTVGRIPELTLGQPAAYAIGGALLATGFVVKVWATMIAGVDTYYYKDMFLRRPIGPFVRSGPYRVLTNPMYGVGQLHGYGYAIIYRSWEGLLAVAVCHALIYVFYFAVEVPFVHRIYRAVEDTPRALNVAINVPDRQSALHR